MRTFRGIFGKDFLGKRYCGRLDDRSNGCVCNVTRVFERDYGVFHVENSCPVVGSLSMKRKLKCREGRRLRCYCAAGVV